MSKAKGKDKKQDNIDQLEKDFQNQKRQLLDMTFTVKRLQERLGFLAQQNHRLQSEKEEQYLVMSQKIEQLSIKNDTNEKRLIAMRNDLTNSQVENKKLSNNIAYLQKNHSDEKADKNKQIEELKKNFSFEIAKYQNMLTDYKLYMSQRDARQKQINQLIQSRQLQIANRIRQVADKERQKIQATDKIKDQMSTKIREMRQNLLSLKKQQLETTTRLTMLQNHQLTSQLQYQSKQTQKIVFKNQQLQNTIQKLKQQLQVRKQVQQQLAKRSHFSKGIIKKLHARVTELQQQLKIKGTKTMSQIQNDQQQINENKSNQNIQSKNELIKKTQKSNKFINELNKQLQYSQKKYADIFSKYQAIKRQHHQISLKYQSNLRIKNQLFISLLKIYTDIFVNKDKNYQNRQNFQLTIDLDQIRRKNPQQWSEEQKRSILQIFLVSCQQFITRNAISIPCLRKIIVFSEQQKNTLPKLITQRQKKNLNISNGQIKGQDKQVEDVCILAKRELSRQKYSVNIAAKIVGSKLRDWGRPVQNKTLSRLHKNHTVKSYRL